MIGIIQVSSDGEKVPYKDYYYRWQVGVIVRVVGKEKANRIIFISSTLLLLFSQPPSFMGNISFSWLI